MRKTRKRSNFIRSLKMKTLREKCRTMMRMRRNITARKRSKTEQWKLIREVLLLKVLHKTPR